MYVVDDVLTLMTERRNGHSSHRQAVPVCSRGNCVARQQRTCSTWDMGATQWTVQDLLITPQRAVTRSPDRRHRITCGCSNLHDRQDAAARRNRNAEAWPQVGCGVTWLRLHLGCPRSPSRCPPPARALVHCATQRRNERARCPTMRGDLRASVPPFAGPRHSGPAHQASTVTIRECVGRRSPMICGLLWRDEGDPSRVRRAPCQARVKCVCLHSYEMAHRLGTAPS